MKTFIDGTEIPKGYVCRVADAIAEACDAEEIFTIEELDSRKEVGSMLFEETDHGITAMSTEFLRAHLHDFPGCVMKVRGYRTGEMDYWVEFSDSFGTTIKVSGFSWGYSGEGPTGLYRACRLLDFPLTQEVIQNIDSNLDWEFTIQQSK